MENTQVESSWPRSRPSKAKVYQETKKVGLATKAMSREIVEKKRLAALQSLDNDILELIEDPDSIAAKVEESRNYHQDVHEILILIENFFTSKVGKPVTSENTGGGSTQQIVHIPSENASCLPKFALPYFFRDPVD